MTTVTREHLYMEVWSEPMTTVAQRYGVSSNYLARICEQLKVPRPSRGYWQQRAVGQDVEREPLPEPDPGDETVWQRHRGGHRGVPPPLPVFSELGARRTRRDARPKTHPQLVGVREEFLDSRVRQYDDDGYLKPKKRALPDIFVSKDTLGYALEFANRFYLALEDEGHWVREAAEFRYSRPQLEHRQGFGHREVYGSRIWTPARPTLVFIGGVAIGLVIFELAEQVEVTYESGQWVRVPQNKATVRAREVAAWRFHERFMPCGRLGLLAYSPYPLGSWERRWEETRSGDLKKMIPDVVAALEVAAPEIATITAEAEIKAEEEHQAYVAKVREERRKEIAQLQAKAVNDSRENLLGVIDAWVTACNVERFFQDLAKEKILNDEERERMAARIDSARAMFGGSDAVQHFRSWTAPDDLFRTAKKGLWWNPEDV